MSDLSDLSGRYRGSFDLTIPAEQAAAFFADPDNHVACFDGLESSQRIDDRTVRFVLPQMSYGVTRFKGAYTCSYERDGTTVRWQSTEGNITARGTARFTDRGAGCHLDYEQNLTIGLQVGRLLRKTIQPFLAASVEKEARAFCERMVKAADAAG